MEDGSVWVSRPLVRKQWGRMGGAGQERSVGTHSLSCGPCPYVYSVDLVIKRQKELQKHTPKNKDEDKPKVTV